MKIRGWKLLWLHKLKKLSHTCEEAEELTPFPFQWTDILTSKQCSIKTALNWNFWFQLQPSISNFKGNFKHEKLGIWEFRIWKFRIWKSEFEKFENSDFENWEFENLEFENLEFGLRNLKIWTLKFWNLRFWNFKIS